MNCRHIENLLAPYVAGDLETADAADVRAHVASCETCRESLAAYRALESALQSRRALVPPVERFIPDLTAGVTKAVANGVAAYTRARRWLDRMVSAPAVTTIVFVMTGLAAFFYRDRLAATVDRSLAAPPPTMLESLESMMAVWTNAMSDTTILVGVCAGVTIVALLSTGIATARLLRH